MSLELVEKLVHEKKYDTIQEFVSIAHMGQKPLCFREYSGTEVRGFEEGGNINLLLPEDITTVQESALAKAITSGSIFDDAEEASRGATYVRLTIIPQRAFDKTNPMPLPRILGTLTKACIGQMDSDGRLPVNQACIDNGANFERDILTSGREGHDIRDIVCNHLSIPEDKEDIPMFLGKAVCDLKKDLPRIKDFNAEDTLDDEDYVEINPTKDAEDLSHENIHSIEENNSDEITKDMDKSFNNSDPESLPDSDDDDAKEAADKDKITVSKPDPASDDDSDEGDDDDADDEGDDEGDDDDDDYDDTDDDYDDDDKVDDYEECGDNCATKTVQEFVCVFSGNARKKMGKVLSNAKSELRKIVDQYKADRFTRGRILNDYAPKHIKSTTTYGSGDDYVKTSYDNEYDIMSKPIQKIYSCMRHCQEVRKKQRFAKKFTDSELATFKRLADYLKDIFEDFNAIFKDGEGFDKLIKNIAENSKKALGEIEGTNMNAGLHGAAEDETIAEGFITRRPKKLKPLPARDIVSYITIEMNNVRDANDQAMLAGYTCSKLELCDFYINCIDTSDDRYVVPHDRAYLVRFQSDLNRLLTQILAIKPINKQDRVWKVNVTYPEGWRG